MRDVWCMCYVSISLIFNRNTTHHNKANKITANDVTELLAEYFNSKNS